MQYPVTNDQHIIERMITHPATGREGEREKNNNKSRHVAMRGVSNGRDSQIKIEKYRGGRVGTDQPRDRARGMAPIPVPIVVIRDHLWYRSA